MVPECKFRNQINYLCSMSVNLDLLPLEEWPIDASFPFVISGPCSAESERQVIETAKELKKGGHVKLLRAGVWKPRTRPNSFEGIGAPALDWLKAAKAETGLPITTEVANAYHVESCLEAGVDVLWIGARTTVNPFSVQEIANALKGVDIPVVVKNPINPDLNLWIGAIERLHLAGINKLMAMHRGFSLSEPSVFRNSPMWEIPIALMTQHPNLPILCDPSHITGKRDLLLPVAQKAFDLGMHGIMIESHPNPDKALSDKAQQVTPDRFNELVSQLHFRKTGTKATEVEDQLASMRSRIDEIDKKVIHLLSDRMEIAKDIGKVKKDMDITVLQLDRWKEIYESRTKLGTELGFSEAFIKRFLEQLHKESIRMQTDIKNKK